MKEIKEKNDKDLAAFLTEKREEVRVFRFGTAGSKVRDVRAQRKTRRMIARVLTEMNARKA
ncbi:50S ribosomal protein L29 [Patescibacteria group bacterium]|jgi:ribosomal protein L29|nr:50S ribosomal protein L29 [Patescibacteria group bacterium]